MKKIYFIPFLLLLFQSCFEVVEEVKMKDDGTGSFSFTANLSQSKTKLNSILKMEKINGHEVPSKEKIKNQIAEIETIVKKTTGISNVKTNIDLTNFVFDINCDFKKVENLNDVVSKLKENKKIDLKIPSDYFSYTGKKFNRSQKIGMKAMYDKMSKADKMVFETAKYTSVYRFESGIKSASNKNIEISKSRKAIKFDASILDIINGNRKIENTITLD